MERYNSMPLHLRIYSTEAEFKAYRQNVSEQNRLECTRSSICREERNSYKCFKKAKLQVERRYAHWLYSRNFKKSSGLLTRTLPSSASSISINSPYSFHRTSGTAPYSSSSKQRISFPSSPLRQRPSQKRLQAFGEDCTHLSSNLTAFRQKTYISESKEVSCEFCIRLSELMDSHKSVVNDAHCWGQPSHQLEETLQRDLMQEPIGKVTKTIGHRCLEIPETVASTQTADNKYEPSSTENDDNRSKKPSAAIPTDALSDFHHVSKLPSIFSAKTATYAFRAKEEPGEEELRRNKDDIDSVSAELCSPSCQVNERVDRNNTKSQLGDLCISLDNSSYIQDKCADLQAATDILFHHAEHCPAARQDCLRKYSPLSGNYRSKSLTFVGLGRKSGYDVSLTIQERVAQFLEKQEEFNKRFPLEYYEIKSLDFVRQDLLQARSIHESERAALTTKARMIAEVLSQLVVGEQGT